MNVYKFTYSTPNGGHYTILNAESMEEAKAKFWSTRHPDLVTIMLICEVQLSDEYVNQERRRRANESSEGSSTNAFDGSERSLGNEILSKRCELEGRPIGDFVFFTNYGDCKRWRDRPFSLIERLFERFVRKKDKASVK